jgi:hypothetical protein
MKMPFDVSHSFDLLTPNTETGLRRRNISAIATRIGAFSLIGACFGSYALCADLPEWPRRALHSQTPKATAPVRRSVTSAPQLPARVRTDPDRDICFQLKRDVQDPSDFSAICPELTPELKARAFSPTQREDCGTKYPCPETAPGIGPTRPWDCGKRYPCPER